MGQNKTKNEQNQKTTHLAQGPDQPNPTLLHVLFDVVGHFQGVFPQPLDKGQDFRGGPTDQQEIVQRQARRQPIAPMPTGQGGQVPFENRGKVLADQFCFVRRVAAPAVAAQLFLKKVPEK